LEILQAGCGNDDGVSLGVVFLRNAQETSTGIFFQRQNKRLAFNLNFLGFKRVFLNKWPRRLWRIVLVIRLVAKWRRPFV
jgi:hypothetical protein